MKNIGGTFIGKSKIGPDSKYYNNEKGLDEDVQRTKTIKLNMQEELNEVLKRYKKQFRMFETAEDLYIEVLREEVIKILKRRREL